MGNKENISIKKNNWKEYNVLIWSDLDRNWMYSELNEFNEDIYIWEIFYSDINYKLTISLDKKDINLDILEWFIAYSKKRLLPINK